MRRFVGLVALAVTSRSVVAQSTLSELIDGGATKLTTQEMMSTFSGAHVSGPRGNGIGQWDAKFNANGSIWGHVTNPGAMNAYIQTQGIHGTWSVDDSGRLCWDVTVEGYGSQHGGDCAFVYRIGDQHYFALPRNEGLSFLVLKRTIKH